MTFIASVAAKRGVAIIADSLVTSQIPILDYPSYLNYIRSKAEESGDENVQIDAEELGTIFRQEPSFTKDYEDKLMKISEYSCLTTCGTAYINRKSISSITEEFVHANLGIIQEDDPDPDQLIAMIKDHFNNEISLHIDSGFDLSNFVLILTHYNSSTKQTSFRKISTNYVSAENNLDEVNSYFEDFNTFGSVICDGQNKISDSILFGFSNDMFYKLPSLIRIALSKLELDENLLTAEILDRIRSDDDFLRLAFEDMQIYNLNDLSLQQAVDLASLLMRIEVDFQKYTKNIPTVGGLIKLAVIDDDGFKYLTGNKIEVPRHINR